MGIMKFSKLFITTYKETPNDAQTPSHQLMHRAGLIQKSGAGLYELFSINGARYFKNRSID